MIMKTPTAIRRLKFLGSAVELRRDRLMIRLPDPRLIRLVARSVLFAVAVLSFPWLDSALRRAGPSALAFRSVDDDDIFLPTLLRDLKDRALYRLEDRAVFIGDPGSSLEFLMQNGMELVSDNEMPALADRTLDFAYAAGDFGGRSFGFINRALKVGGVAAVQLGSDPSESFRLPPNYRMVYARRFASTVVAVRKTAEGDSAENSLDQRTPGRRLLAVPEAKKEALNGLEDVLLEPPVRGLRRRRTRYLPDLMGDSLDGYPRRVFIDVGPPGRAGSAGWFELHYPTRHRDFEMIRVEVVDGAATAVAGGGMSEWLARNVREEEYVVVKAEAEVVEEMIKGRALGLVDELFLECKHQWEKTKGKKKKIDGVRSRRAYWECLALYGKLRDEGVAVHQWWG